MPKKVLSSPTSSPESVAVPDEELFRVEDSIEDFITMLMPTVAGAKIDIIFLFTNKQGINYYRCNYWKLDTSSVVVTRTCSDSRYISVVSTDNKKTLTDLTRK